MFPQLPAQLDQRLELAVRIAREAGDLTLRYFRAAGLQVERKRDDSPVTVADREAEQFLRAQIGERFPDDAILGEELGETSGDSGYRWVLDPIDGTKSFVHGVPLYATLVAVLEGDEPSIGVIDAPACGETVYAGPGTGCWYIDRRSTESTPRQTHVSTKASLSQGLLLTCDVASFDRGRSSDATDVYLRLLREARLSRTWCDAYGYLMVATGRAEAMIDAVLEVWDAAAVKPVIEEAGGRFTDWQGRPTIYSGDAIGSNGLVADEILAVTNGR